MSGQRVLPRNFQDALKWCVAADKQGSSDAANDIGVAYANGWGVPLNRIEAARWYEKAAAEGDPVAKNNLADLNRGTGRR
jgi:TPR repeat protein